MLEDADQNLTPRMRNLLIRLRQEWKQLQSDIEVVSQEIEVISDEDAACQLGLGRFPLRLGDLHAGKSLSGHVRVEQQPAVLTAARWSARQILYQWR